jgi:hypothetical protein
MARTGRTYQSKRNPSHMASEAARLRKMVQEREDEIERLRAVLQSIAEAPHPVGSANRSQLLSDIKDTAESALDGGGGDDE